MVRMYGGNSYRKEVPEDITRCVESVEGSIWGGSHQCLRKRGYGPQGEYCKQHGAMQQRKIARDEAEKMYEKRVKDDESYEDG